MSLTSPVNTPPWIAAPIATTSSGLISDEGSLPKTSVTVRAMIGERVWPPTRMTLSTSDGCNLASQRAFWQGSTDASTRSWTISSNFSRVRVTLMCFGPDGSAAMNGRLIFVSATLESSHFARSAASLRRCRARRSPFKSILFSVLKPSTIHSIMRWSKSSPPRKVLPDVERTSKTPSLISRIEISNVPPPRSYTATFSVFDLPNP